MGQAILLKHNFVIPADVVQSALGAVMSTSGVFDLPVNLADEIKYFDYLPAFIQLHEITGAAYGFSFLFDEETKGIDGLDWIWEEQTFSEMELFEAVAPYVAAGSFIEMQSGDVKTKYTFDGKSCKKTTAKIQWA